MENGVRLHYDSEWVNKVQENKTVKYLRII